MERRATAARTALGAALVAALLLGEAGQAQARARAGDIRLGIDTSVIYFQKHWIRDSEQSLSAFQFGLGASSLGITSGYNITKHIFVGLRAGLYYTRLATDNKGNTSTTWYMGWSILPTFEYLFATSWLRPYMSFCMGVDGTDMEDEDASWRFRIGGGGGVHFFVHRHVSISLGMILSYTYQREETLQYFGYPVGPTTTEIDVDGLILELPFGVTGWF